MKYVYFDENAKGDLTDQAIDKTIEFFCRRITEYEGLDGFAFYILNIVLFTYALLKIDFSIYWQVCFVFGILIFQLTRNLFLKRKGRGRKFLRKMVRAHAFDTKEQEEYYQTLYREVLQKVAETVPYDQKAEADEMLGKLELYLCDDKSAGVYALSYYDICMTRGMLSAPKEQIQAMMARAVSLAIDGSGNKVYMIVADNILVDAIIIALRSIASLLRKLGKTVFALPPAKNIVNTIAEIADNVISDVLLYAYAWIGRTLSFHHDYYVAYCADIVACNCGYGNALYEHLQSTDCNQKTSGVFSVLGRTMPKNLDQRLQFIEKCMGGDFAVQLNKREVDASGFGSPWCFRRI